MQVDGKSYTVESGATFGGNLKVVTFDGTCATFLFGDQSAAGGAGAAHGGAAAGPRGRPR